MASSVTLYAMPEFWLGIVLLLFLAGNQVGLGLFPLGGMNRRRRRRVLAAGWVNVAWHLALPCLTLTLAYLAQYSLVMRSSMLDEMGQDYVQTARAKGLRDLAVRRNARGAERAAAGGDADPALLRLRHLRRAHSGVRLLLARPRHCSPRTAIRRCDYPLLRGLFLLFTASVIVFNLIADVMLGVLDPRVREL